MSIQCVCQNGHVLKVKNSFAGTSGLCPMCKARVDVPHAKPEPVMSEETILSIVGTSRPPSGATAGQLGAVDPSSQSGIGLRKNCDRCNKEVSAGAHICPYCHTYIANLRDF
jgi:hypothetical protein